MHPNISNGQKKVRLTSIFFICFFCLFVLHFTQNNFVVVKNVALAPIAYFFSPLSSSFLLLLLLLLFLCQQIYYRTTCVV